MSSARRPNVIVFFTDQQRADTTGAHGYPQGLTPNFDRMAAQGTHVHHSYTCQPVCGPARSCLQTGYYATQTGVWKNGFRPNPALPTLAQHFNNAGYHTNYIGKWHLAEHKYHGAVPRELQGGYQNWLGANLLEFVSDAYHTSLWDENGQEHKLPGYRVDAITDAAIRYVHGRQGNDQPYFMFMSFLEPHHQNHSDDYPAPAGYEEKYTHAPLPPDLASLKGTAPQHWPGYCGMVKRLDEALGRLLDTLHSLGQLENTVILYTCDHGCHFKTRNAEYKRSCHDASIRVPTALIGPGFTGGGRLSQLVSLVDLPPTLLDAAGITPPAEMPGRSIKALAQKTFAGAWPEEVFVQISESHTGRCVRTNRWKYSVRAPGVDAAGKPVSQPGSDVYVDDFLYDLQADPWELSNLIGMPTFKEVVADMRARLVRRMTAIGEKEPTFIDAPPADPFQRQVEYFGGASVT
jgi:arylsulfatase A-like enzyme